MSCSPSWRTMMSIAMQVPVSVRLRFELASVSLQKQHWLFHCNFAAAQPQDA